MNKFEIVQVVKLDENLIKHNIEYGTYGVILDDNSDSYKIMFLNIKNQGEYCVLNTNKSCISKSNCVLPDEISGELKQFFYNQNNLKPTPFTKSNFKEYDEVELICDRPTYLSRGVKKAMRRTIMADYKTFNQWFVIFTNPETGKDIAELTIYEKDLKLIQ